MATVYLIKFFDLEFRPIILKIGYTTRGNTRITEYHFPLPREVVYIKESRRARKIEQEILQRLKYSKLRLVGKEWFRFDLNLEKEIIFLLKKQ